MKQTHFFNAFTLPQLTEGAELYLSGDLKDLRISSGKIDSGKSGLYWESDKGATPDQISISAQIKGHKGRQPVTYRPVLRWLPRYHLINEVQCNCQIFARDLYFCPHVTALFTALLVHQEGEDALRGTPLEESLRQTTMVDDPFQPGVMKRTDDRLLSLLSQSDTPELPVWRGEQQLKELMRIELDLLPRTISKVYVQVRLGSSRRYQISDLKALLNAYRSRGSFWFGKNYLPVGPQTCDPQAQKVLNLFTGMMTAGEPDASQRGLFDGGSNAQNRCIRMMGSHFDELLQLCDGQTLSLDGIPMQVQLDRRGLQAVLRKKANGATLSVASLNKLCVTGDWIYLYDSAGIFRVQAQGAARQNTLLNMLDWTDPLYIRESDLPAVCRELLPFFCECGTLTARGIDLEGSIVETPAFRFDLDYSDQGALVCLPYALYPKAGQEYRLYDAQSGRGSRNARAEREAAMLCSTCFDSMDPDSLTLSAAMSEDDLYDFFREKLPRLEQLGTVRATDRVHARSVRSLPKLKVGVSLSGGSLLLGLQGSDLSEAELAELLSAYSRKKRYHRLRSGSFVSFEDQDTAAWDTLSDLWQHAGAQDPSHMTLPMYRALYLQEAMSGRQDAQMNASAEYQQLLRTMGSTEQDANVIPASLRDTLRPYQAEGFHWIRMLKKSGFGGILADDMGLGKTLQVLTFLLAEKEQGCTGDKLRTLIVCPASLVYNWQRQLEHFVPQLSSCVIAGTAAARAQLISGENPAEVWITSYDLLKRDIDRYDGIRFANQVIDEAQFIKNQSTQAAQSVRTVSSDFRMALTGTPIENHLSELWSIMDYLMPGFLYTYNRFLKEYETPIVTQQDTAAMDRLRRMVHPFILRRLKKQVLKELPEKMNEVVAVRLQGEQRKLYEAAAARLKQSLQKATDAEYKTQKLMILRELTLLRQLCCDPSLVYDNYGGESEKLQACLQLIHQAVEGGHKLLLFSQFTSMLDIICARLTKDGIPWHRIDGSVSKEDRMQMVDSFANDDVPVFCISLKAGGTGLNLTAADIVIHYDPWWNQAAQDQATDRAHRIGQKQTVNVYELIARGTIEERIQQLKENKSKLADDILSGDSVSSIMFDKEDLLTLLD